MTITITDAQRAFIEAEVTKAGHRDAADYLRSLVERDRERAERLEFNESLREALLGPGIEMTAEDWDDIRREGLRMIAEGEQP